MPRPAGAIRTIGRAVTAVLANLWTVLPVVLAYGLVMGLAESAIYSALTEGLPPEKRGEQAVLLKVLFSWEGAGLAMELLYGPIVAATAVHVGRCWSAGSPAQLYDAVNFALSRYRRLFLPHAAAQVSIRVGMLAIVPGVMFLMQYAFVDPVACLEQERWPLSRSKKLTKGLRRRIFLIFLPILVLSQVLMFADLWALERGALALALVQAGAALMYYAMWVAFYLLYEFRTTPRPA